MNILLIHQNFPGQFRNLVPVWAAKGHVLAAIHSGSRTASYPGVSRCVSDSPNVGNSKGVHPWAQEFESKMIRAEACARACQTLKAEGFEPDLVFAHPGWGEPLMMKSIFPRARLVCLMEFFYRARGLDMGFDPEFPLVSLEEEARLLAKNANLLLAMDMMDLGVTPTPWQASTLPAWLGSKLHVIHEGIDTARFAPDAGAEITLPDRGVTVRPGDEVLTFVARNLEPVRGYHIFMRALPEIMRRRPNVKVFIIGGDGVSYGATPAEGSYRVRYLQEVGSGLDPQRVFFMGQVPYEVFRRLMQITRCHVYLTYPFVLSWSMLEAMSAGALVVGSDTGPVRDVIESGRNGLLADFFDVDALALQVSEVLAEPARFDAMRRNGRNTVIERFDLQTVCLPAYARLLQ
ncbi:glycosyltransferase [Thauera aromatica]|uniref:glycosyltransferase n=1 Tax=Thauera aromatica TaxID=59405 RepID=UPI001FFC421A|nr:glycosyltransferase [Thauera aromatica]MCK2086878.1 glycosyltransferase [Thauera aromatica]